MLKVPTAMQFSIRAITDSDRQWVRTFIQGQWCADYVVAHGITYYPHTLRGFVAENRRGEPVGLATYVIENSECELVTLNSVREGEGIGSALVRATVEEGIRSQCSRLWCVTTNDNMPALTFYQKRGFHIVAVYPGAVERARAIKPSIPLFGIESIPIRDELELEMRLQ